MIDGYTNREVQEWRRIREINYLHYCLNTKEGDRKSKYEYMQLKGDPTEEELAEMKKQEEEEDVKRYYETIQYYHKNGIDF